MDRPFLAKWILTLLLTYEATFYFICPKATMEVEFSYVLIWDLTITWYINLDKLLDFPGLHFFPTVMISQPISILTPYALIVNRQVVLGAKLWGFKAMDLVRGSYTQDKFNNTLILSFIIFKILLSMISSLSKNQREDPVK